MYLLRTKLMLRVYLRDQITFFFLIPQTVSLYNNNIEYGYGSYVGSQWTQEIPKMKSLSKSYPFSPTKACLQRQITLLLEKYLHGLRASRGCAPGPIM